MIDKETLNQPYSPSEPTVITPIDVDKDVIPIYAHKKDGKPPSKFKLLYDIGILAVILLDLTIIFFNQIVMSASFAKAAPYLNLADWLKFYEQSIHPNISAIAGFFTIFLIVELLIRWLIAIIKKTYYRWFFFPFVHWYEVLGCFPLLRPLRLLRAVVIIKRLHEIGIQIIPSRWIKTGKFYGHVLLEELSDRVILTAVDNFRLQMRTSTTHHNLIEETINNNRQELEATLLSLLQRELVPKLQDELKTQLNERLANNVGFAVERALINTPELRRILRMIPIAGTMIENQMADIGRGIAENVVMAVNEQLLSDDALQSLMAQIAHGVAHIDTTDERLQSLVSGLVDDALSAFEAQVKVQQWKHTEQLHL